MRGSVLHIVTALVNEDYYQHIRRCEWSHGVKDALPWYAEIGKTKVESSYRLPDDLVVGRKSVDDLWLCVEILREFDNLWQQGASVSGELYKKLEALEKDLSLYKKQRKISFKCVTVQQFVTEEHLRDEVRNYPDYRYGEEHFLKQKFKRKNVPFYEVTD